MSSLPINSYFFSIHLVGPNFEPRKLIAQMTARLTGRHTYSKGKTSRPLLPALAWLALASPLAGEAPLDDIEFLADRINESSEAEFATVERLSRTMEKFGEPTGG